jgi:hypothetical protein
LPSSQADWQISHHGDIAPTGQSVEPARAGPTSGLSGLLAKVGERRSDVFRWQKGEGHNLANVPEDLSLSVIGDLLAEGLYVFPDGRSPVERAAFDLLPGEHVPYRGPHPGLKVYHKSLLSDNRNP